MIAFADVLNVKMLAMHPAFKQNTSLNVIRLEILGFEDIGNGSMQIYCSTFLSGLQVVTHLQFLRQFHAAQS